MKFTINIRKSVPDNAEFYYTKAKKAKRKINGVELALKETSKSIAKLEKEKGKIILVERKKKEQIKKKWYEKFRWFFSSDNLLVIGGKDATTNEILIKKYLEPNDLVFHAQVQGAPFFVIKNPENEQIPVQTLEEAAQASVSYSKAWKAGWGACDTYYIKPDQVSKTAPSGEYLGKGAFMIYGEKKWFRKTELKMAIGFKINEGVEVVETVEILAGPVSAITKNSNYYITIGVGDLKSGELAKKVKNLVLKKAKKEDGEKIKRVKIEEIQQCIPGGKGMIMVI